MLGKNLGPQKAFPYLLILALLGNLVLAAGPYAAGAHACSCAGMSDTDDVFRRSNAVFAGEVVEIGELPTEQVEPTDPGMLLLAPVTFEVKAAWKGVAGGPVVVHGQGPAPSCGLDFELGETYLVFAGRAGEGDNGPLQTDLCSPTRPASVETARNMFGPPTGTLPEAGGVPSEGAEPAGGPSAAVAAVLASLAVGLVFAGRLARRPWR
jgi:hypothetical protein